MGREVLERILAPFTEEGGRVTLSDEKAEKIITKADLFADGLSGGAGSSELRRELCRRFELPEDMTAKAMLEALNMLVGYSEYKNAVLSLKERI